MSPVVSHRLVPSVEDPPRDVTEGVDPGGRASIVWYISGRGVCRPAVYHLDDLSGVWVRGTACESVVDGGVVVQPTFGGRVEVRLVHLKFDSTAAEDGEDAPWTVNFRLL
ncbi:MAG: hypothetical protein Q8P18_08950 [Pseudomonadota bacterium]|nr:hypothetical protein [Pseudomonadota bacterium]